MLLCGWSAQLNENITTVCIEKKEKIIVCLSVDSLGSGP